MRILVHEFASGGGFAGREVPLSLAREGAAMLGALLSDLALLPDHTIVTTSDPRFRLTAPPRVEVVAIERRPMAMLNALIASVDAVWLIAPETDRCLERLAARVERAGRLVLGPAAAAIRLASDKAALSRCLARHGISHPVTLLVQSPRALIRSSREIGFPLVVKPRRGAGCSGVTLARSVRDVRDAFQAARRVSRDRSVLLQRYVRGTPASVSLLSNGDGAIALSVNAQRLRRSHRFSYRGGRTPLEHPLARRAIEASLRTCHALPGLRGYVGIDLVLTDSEAVVIEVNPRLTTAYLGVRWALGREAGNGGNVAAMAIAACAGRLQPPPPLRRRVRFTSSGRVVCSPLVGSTTPPGCRGIRARPSPRGQPRGLPLHRDL